jgi:hypothetical protein
LSSTLQVPAWHTAPAQQICPLAPQAAHLPALHASPVLHQKPPVLLPGQQGSPGPPQPTQAPAWHAVKGAVQPTPPPQQASPMAPHAPLLHPPFEHVPWPPPHAAPPATHRIAVWSQHPPPPHTTPSQQGCPAPPQVAHLAVVRSQALPGAVQKLPMVPRPPGAPAQQVIPSPPHAPQALLRQAPRGGEPPQSWAGARQAPSTQHRLPPQIALSQHGCPVAPQGTTVPSRHTLPPEGD